MQREREQLVQRQRGLEQIAYSSGESANATSDGFNTITAERLTGARVDRDVPLYPNEFRNTSALICRGPNCNDPALQAAQNYWERRLGRENVHRVSTVDDVHRAMRQVPGPVHVAAHGSGRPGEGGAINLGSERVTAAGQNFPDFASAFQGHPTTFDICSGGACATTVNGPNFLRQFSTITNASASGYNQSIGGTPPYVYDAINPNTIRYTWTPNPPSRRNAAPNRRYSEGEGGLKLWVGKPSRQPRQCGRSIE